MTPTEAFARARDVLLRHANDLEAARAAFAWPALDDFNWAWDWFEPQAARDGAALVLVGDAVTTVSWRALAERSSCTTPRASRREFAALPKTISGKIRRAELRRLEAARRAADERGPTEFWLGELG